MGSSTTSGALSGRRRPRAATTPRLNVTPLVDVVLVLLIIFMVMAPVVNAHFAARLPPKPDDTDKALAQANPNDKPLVLRVEPDGRLTANKVELAPGEASDRLKRMLNARPNTLLYIDSADDAAYGHVLAGIEKARVAGAHPLVLVTEELPLD
ncbi:MAG: biopolymer transporter ExbD [Myxococcales bacterium FL481]|nr:MAG: biopolymer transporter ExbD [Myxococcales bacterium FL481]